MSDPVSPRLFWRPPSSSATQDVSEIGAEPGPGQAHHQGTTQVNKTELIDHIATQADISKAAATRALDALIGGVKTALKKNGSVAIAGFGTFAVTKRAARTGRNPRTGAAIKIKAAKVPKFRAGKALRDALN